MAGKTYEVVVWTYLSLVDIPITSMNDTKFFNHIVCIQSPYLSTECSLNVCLTSELKTTRRQLPDMNDSALGQRSILYCDDVMRDKIVRDETSPLHHGHGLVAMM